MFRKSLATTVVAAALALCASVAQAQILAAGPGVASVANPVLPGPWVGPPPDPADGLGALARRSCS